MYFKSCIWFLYFLRKVSRSSNLTCLYLYIYVYVYTFTLYIFFSSKTVFIAITVIIMIIVNLVQRSRWNTIYSNQWSSRVKSTLIYLRETASPKWRKGCIDPSHTRKTNEHKRTRIPIYMYISHTTYIYIMILDFINAKCTHINASKHSYTIDQCSILNNRNVKPVIRTNRGEYEYVSWCNKNRLKGDLLVPPALTLPLSPPPPDPLTCLTFVKIQIFQNNKSLTATYYFFIFFYILFQRIYRNVELQFRQ